MTVIISSGSTTLNTPDSFYRVEADNLGCFSATALALTTTRYIDLTFANPGSCLGVILDLTTTSMVSRKVTVTLQENTGTWVDVAGATCTLSASSIAGDGLTISPISFNGQYTIPFIIDTPKAITTAPSTWRWKIAHGTGTGTWNLRTSNATIPFHATWCDTKVSFTDNDILIVKDKTIIDKTATLGAKLGTGDTVNGISCVICSNTSAPEIDTVALLEWENPPVSSYELTVGGTIVLGGFGGFRVGTETSRIPISEKAIITFTAPVAGTATSRFAINTGTATSVFGARSSIFIYGEIPEYQTATLAETALTGQAELITSGSTDWVNGDQLVIGKQYIKAQGITTIPHNVVQSVSGSVITLTGNVLTSNRMAGATVIKLDSHGVKLQNTGTFSTHTVFNIGNLVISGADLYNQLFTTLGTSYYFYNTYTKAGCLTQILFEDITFWTNSTSCPYLITAIVPPLGILMQRCYGFRQNFANACIAYYTQHHKSGRLEIKDSAIIGQYSGTISTSTNIRETIENCSFENARASVYFFSMTGISGIYKDNKIWGSGTVYTSNGAVYIGACINPTEISGNQYDYNACALGFNIDSSVNCIDEGSKFGTEYPNTYDIGLAVPGTFPDYIFKDTYGDMVKEETYLPDMIIGGRYGWVNYNNTADDDRTTYTLGKIRKVSTPVNTPDGYSMRFEPLSSSERFEFSFDVPTGNIQNKTMAVSIMCKLNSSVYYSGASYEMPRLTIAYDGSTQSYSELQKNTDWQNLSVVFTPTTEAGKVTAILSGMTDAIDEDSFFYWDDASVLYPAGYKLDLGGLDIWDNALPVLPPIATVFSPRDIWTIQTSSLTGEGTIGKKMAELSSGETISASTIWEYNDRTLTEEFPNGISASTIWEYNDRTLTTISIDYNAIADAVWNELLSSHSVVGSAGSAISQLLSTDIFQTIIENGYTFEQIIKIMVAVLAGKLSGGTTTTLRFRDLADTIDRLIVTVDDKANRTNITRNI